MIAAMVLSNLLYVVGAIVAATVVSGIVWLRHRRPKSLEAGIEMFSRELKALQPERPGVAVRGKTVQGGRSPNGGSPSARSPSGRSPSGGSGSHARRVPSTPVESRIPSPDQENESG